MIQETFKYSNSIHVSLSTIYMNATNFLTEQVQTFFNTT